MSHPLWDRVLRWALMTDDVEAAIERATGAVSGELEDLRTCVETAVPAGAARSYQRLLRDLLPILNRTGLSSTTFWERWRALPGSDDPALEPLRRTVRRFLAARQIRDARLSPDWPDDPAGIQALRAAMLEGRQAERMVVMAIGLLARRRVPADLVPAAPPAGSGSEPVAFTGERESRGE